VSWWKKGINKKKFSLYFTHLPRSPHRRICTKFGAAVGAANVITCTNFFGDWSRGVNSVGGGRKLPSPIDKAAQPVITFVTTHFIAMYFVTWFLASVFIFLPSVLCHCWFGVRKSIWACKKLCGGVMTWLSVWSEVQTCIRPSWFHCHSLSWFSKIWIGFTFLVLAHLASPVKSAVKQVCVCVGDPIDIKVHVTWFVPVR